LSLSSSPAPLRRFPLAHSPYTLLRSTLPSLSPTALLAEFVPTFVRRNSNPGRSRHSQRRIRASTRLQGKHFPLHDSAPIPLNSSCVQICGCGNFSEDFSGVEITRIWCGWFGVFLIFARFVRPFQSGPACARHVHGGARSRRPQVGARGE
jgi:hypothetical protein